MFSKNTIKHINSLKLRKFRLLHKQFFAEGPKLVSELLESDFIVEQVLGLPESGIMGIQHKYPETEFVSITKKELDRISLLKTPNEVVAITEIPASGLFPIMAFSDIVLLLDEIKDPGNMGTIIRTADWFGIRHIVCTRDSVDVFNPKTVQATMGSLTRVCVHYTDLVAFLKNIPDGLPVYGTLLDGKNIYDTQLSENGIIIIGNESRGISKELLSFITEPIYFPHFPSTQKAGAESLNASVATAVVLAEFRRQKTAL
ncbi:MAG: RNA methyltransferase [Chlorobi bacterium]|nr:RNA methyltransferase [Chlorobiota bacterium]